MTTEALSGEIAKLGKSGTNYVFGFGWSCRYNLEQVYGSGLKDFFEEKDQAKVIANTLLAALKARKSNKIGDDFTLQQMYELLDDLGEPAVKEVWDAAVHSMGFLNRLLGISDELVAELAREATKATRVVVDTNPQTGTGSSN